MDNSDKRYVNAGYTILERYPVGSIEIVLAENKNAPSPYVTWQCRNGTDYEIGKYFATKKSAMKSFKERIMHTVKADLQIFYKVKEPER